MSKLKFVWVGCALFVAAQLGAVREETLLVGCTPSEASLKSLESLAGYHFLDQYNPNPQKASASSREGSCECIFFNYRVGAAGMPEARDFKHFKEDHPGHTYKKIIIDWGTYHHIREPSAWCQLLRILEEGGSLIFPVYAVSMFGPKEAPPIVKDKVRGFLDSLSKDHVLDGCDVETYFGADVDLTPVFIQKGAAVLARVERWGAADLSQKSPQDCALVCITKLSKRELRDDKRL